MPVTSAELNDFQSFALAKLADSSADSMRDLFEMYLEENPPQEESTEAIQAIQEALQDVEAGRVRDFDEVNESILKQHGWDK